MTRWLGTFVTDHQLRQHAVQLVHDWVGVVADEIHYQATGERIRFARPRTVVARERAWPALFSEDQLPAILIGTPGSSDAEIRDGSGSYSEALRMEVRTYVQSSDEVVGAQIASVLGLAAARVLLAKLPGSLDGHVRSVKWEGRRADDDGPMDRAKHASAHTLAVVLDGVISDTAFPADLQPDQPRGPAPDPGTVPVVEEAGAHVTPVQEIA